MKKWEYLFLNYVGEENWVDLQDKMIELGKNGWELVTYMDDIHYLEECREQKKEPVLNVRLFIFKQPVE